MTAYSLLDLALSFAILWFLLSAAMRRGKRKPKNTAVYFESADIASAQRRKFRR